MKRLLITIVMTVACVVTMNAASPAKSLLELPPYERAIRIIKYYETLHTPSHWPTIGYGHVVKPGEPYRKGIQLTEQQADSLLRRDMNELCAVFRSYGQSTVLLACLSYNCGVQRVLCSNLMRKVQTGDTELLTDYLTFCHYQGRLHPGLLRRRWIEYSLLYNS
jgi:GH24 family phage-related lysozyme (muramidase)